jgi:hypothetical protein
MIRKRITRIAAVALVGGIAVALGWGTRPATASPSLSEPYVVHEWGTFSTFGGSNGKALKFTPDDRDLPPFVHARHHYLKGGLADVYVSLETPVLYFYTDRDRTVNVRVDFPKGTMTDWYPEPSRLPEQTIRWDELKVSAKDRPRLVGEEDSGRYFAARETDAATVHTTTSEKKETERFLFYRGIGDFEMPFVVRAHGDGRFTVKNTGNDAVPAFVLVNVKDRAVTFKVFGSLAAGAEAKAELPPKASTEDKLADEMAKMLIGQGLYEKEARAMVKTWQKDWFGTVGTRVLYLVARPVTDEFLPIQVDPKPDRLVRVLVGRHDVLTPEKEREIDAQVKRLTGDSNSEAKAADTELGKLGRYRAAAQRAAEERLKAGGTRAGR